MPFDDASMRADLPTDQSPDVVVVKNTLAAIGLQPVPRAEAERHKQKVIRAFAARSFAEATLVATRQVYWRAVSLYDLDILTRPPTSSPERLGAPAAIITLAKDVQDNLTNPKFQLEYFYDDPILNVMYTDATGVDHCDCLGIWDQGTVLAIAKGDIKPQFRFRWQFGSLEASLLAVVALAMIGMFI